MTDRLKKKIILFKFFALAALFFALQISALAQGVKRVVIIKVDGLPGYYVDQFVKQRDPQTGKSMLPWFDEVFYRNGTHLENFYTRGMSLSAPSWSMLDTGQHLQIKGNVEFDRYTLRSYDYLNVFPYYVNYGLKKRADMPGVEVLDQLKIPLLYDAFQYQNRYTSYQLFQRGVEWETLAGGFVRAFPTAPQDLLDEWTIGFDLRNATIDQNERDIAGKLDKNPEMNYFDIFVGSFDHVSHSNHDTLSRLTVLKELDRTVGRIWTAIQKSNRAAETALFLVSDHGFNSDDKIYSQGFNLVKLLGSSAGGGHHVITKRRLMLDYSLKGVNPFVPLITTTSSDSYYLKNQSGDYPTALVDFDGNERSSLHLRDVDLNVMQILLQQLKDKKLAAPLREAATRSFFEIVDRRRANWQKEVTDLSQELDVLHRWAEGQRQIFKTLPKKFTPAEIAQGLDKEAVRLSAQIESAERDETSYREYLRTLANLIALSPQNFDAEKIKIEDYIAKDSMGDANSIYDLQNYVVGLAAQGLISNADGEIDYDKSFRRVDYFNFLENQKVLNNVQPEVSSQPIDFIAARINSQEVINQLPAELKPDEAPIWLYGGKDKQALILTRKDLNGNQSYRYLPIADLRETADGKVTFETKNWDAGFPLKIFEDANLNVSQTNKISWLDGWHTEDEWFQTVYQTTYSNAVIGLNEQMDSHPLAGHEDDSKNSSSDAELLHRLRLRQRQLVEADLLLVANNHWNFDVRGFNPGGNHGSFFHVSTNAALMAAGGTQTGIPRGVTVENPYDNMSFVPTVLSLMGKVNRQGEPNTELYQIGFKKFPGKIIKEFSAAQ